MGSRTFTDTEVLQQCLTFLKELNNTFWKKVHPESREKEEMEIYARSLEAKVFNQLNPDKMQIVYKHEQRQDIRAFTVDCYMAVVYVHPEGQHGIAIKKANINCIENKN